MKLILLGTGGYFPTVQRQTACLLLPEIGVVLDAGSGMSRLGLFLETDHVNIFLSHAHLDHVIGLTYLINVVPGNVLQRSVVHAESAKIQAIQDHLFAEPIFPVPPSFNFKPLQTSCELPSGGRLTTFVLKHPGGAIGFRLDWPNRSMAYVTDTTAALSSTYLQHIRDVDLLIHECYFATSEEALANLTGHSALAPVAQVAAAVNAKQLVLVHLNPMQEADDYLDLAASRKLFPNIALGADLMEIDF